ncbi:MAG: hypothetical protein K0M69_16495 [Youngiibacter sp.]|nr:hypothetical protein [Youngiibacter sp.]
MKKYKIISAVLLMSLLVSSCAIAEKKVPPTSDGDVKVYGQETKDETNSELKRLPFVHYSKDDKDMVRLLERVKAIPVDAPAPAEVLAAEAPTAEPAVKVATAAPSAPVTTTVKKKTTSPAPAPAPAPATAPAQAPATYHEPKQKPQKYK